MVGKTVMHLNRTPSCNQHQCLYPRLLYIIHSHLVPDFSHCIIKETPHHCIISCHTHSSMVIGWYGQEMLHNNPFILEVSLRMVLSMRRKWCSSMRVLQRCPTGRQILGCPQAVQKVLHQSRGESAGPSWDSRLILGMNPVNLQVAGKGIVSHQWDTRKRRKVDVGLEGRGMKTLTAAVRIVVPTVTERRPAGWVTVAPHFPNCKPLMAGLRTGSLSSSSLRTWLAAVDGVRWRSWRVCNHVSVAKLSRLSAVAQRRWKGIIGCWSKHWKNAMVSKNSPVSPEGKLCLWSRKKVNLSTILQIRFWTRWLRVSLRWMMRCCRVWLWMLSCGVAKTGVQLLQQRKRIPCGCRMLSKKSGHQQQIWELLGSPQHSLVSCHTRTEPQLRKSQRTSYPDNKLQMSRNLSVIIWRWVDRAQGIAVEPGVVGNPVAPPAPIACVSDVAVGNIWLEIALQVKACASIASRRDMSPRIAPRRRRKLGAQIQMPGKPLRSRENRLGWFRWPRSHPTWWGSRSKNCWSGSFPAWDNTRDGFHWARQASCSIKEGWCEERGRLVSRDPHISGYSGNGMLIRVWRGFLLGAGRVSTWRSSKAKNCPAVYMDRETRG